MVKIGLQIKANLENVTNLTAVGDDFRWFLKIRNTFTTSFNIQFTCANCGEASDKWLYLTAEAFKKQETDCILIKEKMPIKGSRGEANLVLKCKLCSRENTVSLIENSLSTYTIDDSNNFKTIVAFECRGVEPNDFSARNGFSAEGVESNTKFENINLEEDWVDYDEKSKESVGIYELTHKFIKL
ncbi:UPF0587 protein-like protein [Leptotrombidium deliense]|uniref:UPF0587 protein-like protein n=1 Tax=Leptotrombidium deliense TaxID=299467 RepID=A0A443SAK7_9ACAR|nr:UPF0587 protein-like protein [Leptotrombidium deliense]